MQSSAEVCPLKCRQCVCVCVRQLFLAVLFLHMASNSWIIGCSHAVFLLARTLRDQVTAHTMVE